MTGVELGTGQLPKWESERSSVGARDYGLTLRVRPKIEKALKRVKKVVANESNAVIERIVVSRNVYQAEDPVWVSAGLREVVSGAYGRG